MYEACLVEFQEGLTGLRGGTLNSWCRLGESNPRPRDYETLALPLSYAGTKTMLNATESIAKVSSIPAATRRSGFAHFLHTLARHILGANIQLLRNSKQSFDNFLLLGYSSAYIMPRLTPAARLAFFISTSLELSADP